MTDRAQRCHVCTRPCSDGYVCHACTEQARADLATRDLIAEVARLTGSSEATIEKALRKMVEAYNTNAEAIHALVDAATTGPHGSKGRVAQRSPYDIGRRK